MGGGLQGRVASRERGAWLDRRFRREAIQGGEVTVEVVVDERIEHGGPAGKAPGAAQAPGIGKEHAPERRIDPKVGDGWVRKQTGNKHGVADVAVGIVQGGETGDARDQVFLKYKAEGAIAKVRAVRTGGFVERLEIAVADAGLAEGVNPGDRDAQAR